MAAGQRLAHGNNIETSKLLLLSDEAYRPNRQGKIESEPNLHPVNC